MLGLEHWFGERAAVAPLPWPGQDVVNDAARVGAVLDALGEEAGRGRARLTLLGPDGCCRHAVCTMAAARAASVRIRLAAGDPGAALEGALVAFCLQQRMHLFDARVLCARGVDEFDLARPACLVQGGGRAFFRAEPPEPQSMVLRFAGGCLNGQLADLGEGGLALWLDAPAAAGLAPGATLHDVRLGLAWLTLPAAQARICSLLAPRDDGRVRLGLELVALEEGAAAALRRLVLAWQCGLLLSHGR